MNYRIISDSTSDLSPEQLQRYNIRLMPLYVNLGDKTFRDGVDVTPDDIYAHVAAGGGLASTAALNLADFAQVFAEEAPKHDFVLHINISSEFSSCHQNAKLAAAEYDNVYVVDSRNLSTGHGLVVLEAVRMAESGMEPQAIVEALSAMTGKVQASFLLSQLEYMKKGGRCSTVAALGANLLKLRPCIEVREGKMGVAKKYRGAFEKTVQEYVRDQFSAAGDVDLTRVFITHSGVEQSVIDAALEAVKDCHAFGEICITRAGCTISSHCGPGTIGVLFIEK